jgi:hypothetical protein
MKTLKVALWWAAMVCAPFVMAPLHEHFGLIGLIPILILGLGMGLIYFPVINN